MSCSDLILFSFAWLIKFFSVLVNMRCMMCIQASLSIVMATTAIHPLPSQVGLSPQGTENRHFYPLLSSLLSSHSLSLSIVNLLLLSQNDRGRRIKKKRLVGVFVFSALFSEILSSSTASWELTFSSSLW